MSAVAVAMAAGTWSAGRHLRLRLRLPLCGGAAKGSGSAAWKARGVVVARVYRPKAPSQSQSRFLDMSSESSFFDPALDINSLRSSSVRLIDKEQKMVGVVSKSEAIQMADNAELDLVILSGDAVPPVVRIMDYRKYKFELQKKKREQQKKSAASRADLKELKMGSNIDVHDYTVRLQAAKRFLKEGDKVKIIVQFKARAHNFRENAMSLFERFENDLGKMAILETKNFADKVMSITFAPNKGVLDKLEENPRTEQEENPSTEQVSAGVVLDKLEDNPTD